MNLLTSQDVFAGPYLDDPAEREKFGQAFLDMTNGFLAFPICLPGTTVWKGRQGRMYVISVLKKAAARSKANMKVTDEGQGQSEYLSQQPLSVSPCGGLPWKDECLGHVCHQGISPEPHYGTLDRSASDCVPRCLEHPRERSDSFACDRRCQRMPWPSIPLAALLAGPPAERLLVVQDGKEPACLMDFWALRCLEEMREAEAAGRQPDPHTADLGMADTVMDFLFASQDASTASLVWMISLMADHPDVLQKVRPSPACACKARVQECVRGSQLCRGLELNVL